MDVNGTRFHLLLGEADWARCRTAGGRPAFDPAARAVQWNPAHHEVTLWRREFRFVGARGALRLTPADRRGAARDRFGSWYWIAPDRASLLVRSSGSHAVSAFWPTDPPDAVPCGADDGGFRACPPRESVSVRALQGLAATDDHYLVVGTAGPPGGLLVFDLYAGGAPRQRLWPAAAAFEPFDLAPRRGGGVWVLDRAQRRVWELDRRFEVVTADAGAEPTEVGDFASADDRTRADVVARTPVRPEQAWPVPAADPVAIEALPDGDGVLVLERTDDPARGDAGFARVHWLAGGAPRGAPASLAALADRVEPAPGAPPFALPGHDMALGAVPGAYGARDATDDRAGRLWVVGPDGDQAFAFDVRTAGGALALTPVTEYYPMRLFGGRALVAAAGEPWYDGGDAWLRLLHQNRPRHVEQGELWTPVLDGREPACVWHRLMLDACIPPGTAVDVYTRTSDDWRELTLVEWLSPAERRALGAPAEGAAAAPETGDPVVADDLAPWQPEPAPILRGDGPELPYLPREDRVAGRGTWELLFQRARGRYLQVRLVLRGNGSGTPRVRALRAWFPRFSYLEQYLPAVYREDPTSASFLDRFLANVEGTFTVIEDRAAAAQVLFDVASAPPDALDWLASWLGVALDPSWEDDRRRLFIAHAMEFFAMRGTVRGVQLALRLALDACVDERLFAPPARGAPSTLRIVERYRTRRTRPALVGDVTTLAPGPRAADAGARWEPSVGSVELHRRWADALGLPAGSAFPIVGEGAPDGWQAFAERTLGFEPSAGAGERARWRTFLHQRGLPAGTPLPAAEPTAEGTSVPSAQDWRAFLAATPNRQRRLWQDFLARRYRTAGALSAAWKAVWSSFDAVPLPDRLPPDGPALADWFQFEGVVLAMYRTAHRFTVMLPVPPHLRTDIPAQRRRVALARMVLDLEKPAHTVFDLRFYWAMFRLGEARLGDDTVVDLGSRSPALMPPMVLGEGYLAEAFLAVPPDADAPARTRVGRDRVGRSTWLGGP